MFCSDIQPPITNAPFFSQFNHAAEKFFRIKVFHKRKRRMPDSHLMSDSESKSNLKDKFDSHCACRFCGLPARIFNERVAFRPFRFLLRA
jgi:hypothetical protein